MTVDRSDGLGLGMAIVGHVLLFVALSLTIAHRVPPVKPVQETMDVQLVEAIGPRSAAPEPAREAPREAEAPDIGPPRETPPPEPEPTPAPRPAPTAKPAPAPLPTPTPIKPAPAKPSPAKPAVAKPAAARPALSSDLLKDIGKAARNERATGQKLGPDFLKGVLGAAAGKGASARAAISGPAMNGLAAAIIRQVKPCYDLGALGGTAAMQIVTVLRLRFNPDGTVAGAPQMIEQDGVTDANRAYSQQMADLSRRAVLRCAPLKLPPELYQGGWEMIDMGFRPVQMR